MQKYDVNDSTTMVFFNDPGLYIFSKGKDGKLKPINQKAMEYALNQGNFADRMGELILRFTEIFKDKKKVKRQISNKKVKGNGITDLISILKDKPKALKLSTEIGVYLMDNENKDAKKLLNNPNLKHDLILLGNAINDNKDLTDKPRGNYARL